MNVQNQSLPRGRAQAKKGERFSPEETLRRLMEEHKRNSPEMVLIRIDDRTHIELPAAMSEQDRQERIKNYLKNSNFKPAKSLL